MQEYSQVIVISIWNVLTEKICLQIEIWLLFFFFFYWVNERIYKAVYKFSVNAINNFILKRALEYCWEYDLIKLSLLIKLTVGTLV